MGLMTDPERTLSHASDSTKETPAAPKRSRLRRVLRGAALGLLGLGVVVGVIAAVGFRQTSHAATPAPALGRSTSTEAMEAVLDQPGPLTVDTIVSADWLIPRAGLIDLDDPKAKAAGLKDEEEPIQIYMYAVRHPDKGLYLVDSGVEHWVVDDPSESLFSGPIGWFMNLKKLRVRVDTRAWLSAQDQPLAGVFLTHLHLDHVSGLRDVPSEVPVFIGPGEGRSRAADHAFTQGVTDAALGEHPLHELAIDRDSSAAFEGVLDVFGDQSFFAIWVPGHTAGSLAFVARTTTGPVLMTGDACHTRWGWENGVAPGSFTRDHAANAVSLSRLKSLVERHPKIDVRLGHQMLREGAESGG
ncbi:MAG: MBL fold metallo-hydrolase [Polyangiaceae bacterium]